MKNLPELKPMMLSTITLLTLITPVILLEAIRSGVMQQIEHTMANTQLLVNNCATDVNASQEDITNFLSHKAQVNAEGNCLVACVLKANGVILNGEVQNDTLINTLKLYPNLHEDNVKTQEVVNDCKEVATPVADNCTYAAVFSACLDVKMKRIVRARVLRIREEGLSLEGDLRRSAPRERGREEAARRMLTWAI